MGTTHHRNQAIQFGVFEVDLRAGELRRQGMKLKLQEKPFQVLTVLLERPGEVVTREELQRRLWPEDTFVDFDHSMNTAVNKLREALGDSAESPRFIETLPKRGYRFIALVQPAGRGLAGAEVAPAMGRRPAVIGVVAALVVVLALGAYLVWQRWGRRATPPEGRIMLAVLPFENLSGDPEQEYFSDGMTEEMISQLGQVHPERLGVIARTSAMRYKKTDKRIDEIGRELGVDYVVEGSVRRANERVRVTAQLIQVSDQTKVWSDSYESSVGDVLALQNEVARAIASEIQLKFTPQEETLPARTRPVNPEAYEAFLKGRYYFHKGNLANFKQAFEHFQQAISKDPNYAPAHVGLAECYTQGNYLGLQPREAMPKAKAAALKALELDEELGDAHAALASALFYYDWDWEAAGREFKRALELDPGSTHVHASYAWYVAALGRSEEAIAEAQQARVLDPLDLGTYVTVGRTFYFARRYDEAIEQYRKALELDPNYYWARFFMGLAYEQKGMHGEAITEIAKAHALNGSEEFATQLEKAYRERGYQGALRTWAERWQRPAQPGTPRAQASSVALIYLRLGEKELALQWLEKAHEERSRALVFSKVEPQLDPLRSDPRFKQFLRRMNLPEE